MSLARLLSKLLNSSGQVPTAGLSDTAVTPAKLANSGSELGTRNRIINGAMMIDQRNAGASVTPTTSGQYTLDRFSGTLTQASKYSVQQNAGSVTPPAGFKNYLGVTSASAYSVVSGDSFTIRQMVEGFNVADLAWGTASASPVTLSFWVRSSLTGSFGGSLSNSAGNRCYVFAYTINAANTWEYKTATVAGDTSGTWATDTGIGIRLDIGLGSGATYSGAAGSWGSSFLTNVTGATSVVGISGATFYITGVQLEKGSTATSFDYRPYGTELALCQRYYEKSFAQSLAPSTANFAASCRANITSIGGAACGSYNAFGFSYKQVKRASPTLTTYSGTSTSQLRYLKTSGSTVDGGDGGSFTNDTYFGVLASYSGSGSTADIVSISFEYTANAEL